MNDCGACERNETVDDCSARSHLGNYQHRRSSSSSGSTATMLGYNNPPKMNNCELLERGKGHHHHHQRSKSGVYDKRNFDELEFVDEISRTSVRPKTLYPPALDKENTTNADPTRSLLLLPEKETLLFDINLVGAPPEVEQLVNNIKQVAQQFLYHWKSFPIVLPMPLTSKESEVSSSKSKLNLRDLFIAPCFDELELVAVNSNGEPRKLSNKQQERIRERGEFEVESINFPGQQHRWRLSALLQKGRARTRTTLLNDLALGLHVLVVTAKARLVSDVCSLSASLRALSHGCVRILDLLIGIPNLRVHNLDGKMKEERAKYLVAELMCRMENEDALELLCSFIRKQVKRAATEKIELTKECGNYQSALSIPYNFVTPSGIDLDLRLWDRNLMKRKAYPLLANILERETRGWFLHYRERLILEMKAQQMSAKQITSAVNEAVMNEYLQRVFGAIHTNPDLLQLGNGITQLLIEQAQSVFLMHKALENIEKRLADAQEETRSRLCVSHPILSRIEPWLRERLHLAEQQFRIDNLWSFHEEALALCSNSHSDGGSICGRLSQTVYFLNRDLIFMKEREPALLRELEKVKFPTKRFHWPTQIWYPINWLIRRNFQGHSELIPTVLTAHATTITTPRSDPSQPVFLVERAIVRTTTTRWPCWRLFNYFHRSWSWTWNAMFFLIVYVPWSSPCGLRALLALEPFIADMELSQVNGTLFPRRTHATDTLWSRVTQLWRHISKSRTHFETQPDTGFIGRGPVTRHVNQLWNYVVKGVLGTIALIFLFPCACVTLTAISVLLGVTACVWMPLVTAGVHVTNAFIYDLDCPDPSKKQRYLPVFHALLWHVACLGIGQPLIAFVIAFIVCPIVAMAMFIVALTRYCSRLLWDTIMFHLLIKKRGRIPASDTVIVKRIAGPGLAVTTTDYHFQIRPEQALAAFDARIQLDELNLYQMRTERAIRQPQHDFAQFIEACFGSFAGQLNKTGAPYRQLEKDSVAFLALLNEKVERRRRDLQIGLGVNVRNKIKMTTFDLKTAIQQGAAMLERHYPTHILSALDNDENGRNQFWESRGLCANDWIGLASLLYTEIFSADILVPLDLQTDVSFRLDPDAQVDLSRYSKMVYNAQLGVGTDTDLLNNIFMSKSGNIHINPPYLDVAVFNPRAQMIATRKNEKKTVSASTTTLNSMRSNTMNAKSATMWRSSTGRDCPEKIMIPLPIPHPVYIATTIYNRDVDDPICLESEICQNILKSIEDNYSIIMEKDNCEAIEATDCLEGSSSLESAANDAKPCRDDESNHVKKTSQNSSNLAEQVCYWTLGNWGEKRKRIMNATSTKVDLASPEDVTLDSDSSRAIFNVYGTTV